MTNLLSSYLHEKQPLFYMYEDDLVLVFGDNPDALIRHIG